jgi:hypothetical protein
LVFHRKAFGRTLRFIDETNARVLDSVGMASCIVSFVDTEGIRHTVEVQAESLFEAAALAIRTFKQHDCEPGLITQLDVEIRSCITHTVTRKKIHQWLHGGAKSPREAVMKERLRELLETPLEKPKAMEQGRSG